MNAQNFLAFICDDQFHVGPLITARQGVFHRPEPTFVNIHLAVILYGLLFGQPNRSKGRLAEHSRCHIVVADLARPAPKQAVCEGVPFCNRHRCQIYSVSNVTNRIDMFDVGA